MAQKTYWPESAQPSGIGHEPSEIPRHISLEWGLVGSLVGDFH